MKKIRICQVILPFAVLVTSMSHMAYSQTRTGKLKIEIRYGHNDGFDDPYGPGTPAFMEHSYCPDPGGICEILPVFTPNYNAFAMVRVGCLEVTFTEPVRDAELTLHGNDRYLVAYTDITVPLDVKTAADVGATSLTVAQGEYRMDYSNSLYGTVQLKLKSVSPSVGGSMQVK